MFVNSSSKPGMRLALAPARRLLAGLLLAGALLTGVGCDLGESTLSSAADSKRLDQAARIAPIPPCCPR
jgi:hypothetical protein